MSNSKGNAHEFSLKVYVNKQNTKVLFAEADRDFVEVLISFLTLPLGTIVRVLRKHYGDNHDSAPVFGSITSLYDGISKLDSVNFWTEGCKEVLLNPIRSTFEDEYRNLKVDINDNQQPNESFNSSCGNTKCGYNWASCRSVYYDTAKCVRCQKIMTRKVDERQSYGSCEFACGGVFLTLNRAPLKISDDLHILPSTVGFVQTVRNLGLTNTDVGTPRDVTLGYNEIMDLLKRSLVSETPLSDVILNKRQVESATPKSEPGILLPFSEVAKEAIDSNSEAKLILKVMVHSSSNKLLYAQADDDFINFLFSSLAVPLGALESVAGGNPCLKNINNLHKSIPNILNDKIVYKNRNTKERLMNPKLSHGYIPENPILPFTEECERSYHGNVCLSSANFPAGKGKYVKGPLMYNISDDLTVTPFCLFSFLAFLEREKIDVSDVKELELEIGVEEAVSILKASVTSTCALTDGVNSILKKMDRIKKPRIYYDDFPF